MSNLPLAFAEILIGGIIATAGVTGDSFSNIIKGEITKHPLDGSSTSSTSSSSSSSSSGGPGGGVVSGAPVSVGKTSAGETAFANSFLSAIGAPHNKASLAALRDWWAAEEGNNVLVPGHGGLNNPFEVTTSGSANVPTLGSVNSSGVKSYATPQQGVEAAIGYFDTYGQGVLQAFREGLSITEIEAAVRNLGPVAFGSDTALPWSMN